MNFTSTDDVAPLAKVNSTWQVPAPLALTVIPCESSNTAQWPPSGLLPAGQTSHGPVVLTVGGSVDTHSVLITYAEV
jgi:hypothetical protein